MNEWNFPRKLFITKLKVSKKVYVYVEKPIIYIKS